MNLSIPYPEEGTYVIGGTGTGKSTLLYNLMVDELRAGHAFAFLDPHRDLAPEVASHIEPSKRIVLDINQGFGINLFACNDPDNPDAVGRVLAQVKQAFAKLWRAELVETPLIADYLVHSALPMILTDGTMETLRTFLGSGPEGKAYREQFLRQLPAGYDYVRDFWRGHEALGPNTREESLGAVARRVRYFLADPITGKIFNRPEQSVDWRRVMDEGTSVIVLLDGQLQDETSFVGAILLGQILSAVLSRSDTTYRPPYGLFVDEYDSMATSAVASLFTQGRKYNMRPFMAHQHRGNLDEEMKRATLQVANIFALRTSPQDAEVVAGAYDTTPPEPEVRGTLPVRAPTPDPVRSLVEKGHPDPQIQSLVWGFLRELVEFPQKHAPYGYRWVTPAGEDRAYATSIDSVRSGITRINHFFVESMWRRIDPKLPAYAMEIVLILRDLRGYAGIFDEATLLDPIDLGLYDWQVRSIAEHEEELRIPQPVKMTTREKDVLWNTVQEVLDGKGASTAWGATPTQAQRIYGWTHMLQQIAIALYQNPVFSDTGQYLEQKERPRSHDDVRSEVVKDLATLPSMMMRVRIRIDKKDSPDGKGFLFQEMEIPSRPARGPYPFFVTTTAARSTPVSPTNQYEEVVFTDEPVTPNWHWETIKKPAAKAAAPPRQQGWHWETISKPAAKPVVPSRRQGWHWEIVSKPTSPPPVEPQPNKPQPLTERVKELREEPPPTGKKKGPPPI